MSASAAIRGKAPSLRQRRRRRQGEDHGAPAGPRELLVPAAVPQKNVAALGSAAIPVDVGDPKPAAHAVALPGNGAALVGDAAPTGICGPASQAAPPDDGAALAMAAAVGGAAPAAVPSVTQPSLVVSAGTRPVATPRRGRGKSRHGGRSPRATGGGFSAADKRYIEAAHFDALLHESAVLDATAEASAAEAALTHTATAFVSALAAVGGVARMTLGSLDYWRIRPLRTAMVAARASRDVAVEALLRLDAVGRIAGTAYLLRLSVATGRAPPAMTGDARSALAVPGASSSRVTASADICVPANLCEPSAPAADPPGYGAVLVPVGVGEAAVPAVSAIVDAVAAAKAADVACQLAAAVFGSALDAAGGMPREFPGSAPPGVGAGPVGLDRH